MNGGIYHTDFGEKMDKCYFCILPNGIAAGVAGMQDINASTETVYPVINNNSMNKKLEKAKKWLKEREEQKKNA